MKDQNIKDMQRRLTSELIEKQFIKTKEVEEAFLTVPRHLFLPGEDLEKVYSDTPIVTKWDDKIPLSSSSQPAAMTIMLEQLELKSGLKILEIGAGTGFNAALMAQITGKNGMVVTVDIDKDITNIARENLNSAGYSNVKVICKDGASGYEPEAPYDRIILTAGVWDINREWFDQLKPGGILLVPMVISIIDQMTIAFKRVDDHLESTSISGCKFMELRGNYPKPVNRIEIGQSGQLMLCSKHIFKLNKEDFYINSKYPWKDFSTGIKASMMEINRGLLPWLEIAEPKFCLLASAVEAVKILNLPVLPNYKGRSSPLLYGLADKKNICFINFIEQETQKTDDPNLKLFILHVRNFGAVESLAEQLVERITEWGKAGRPEIYNIKVKAYFNKIVPSKDEHLITKKLVNLIFSRTNSK